MSERTYTWEDPFAFLEEAAGLSGLEAMQGGKGQSKARGAGRL